EDSAAAPLPVPSGLNILIAEDNAINALLAERVLANVGCTTTTVMDGAAAVEAVERNLAGDGPAFDLALFDVHMPRLDGLEAVEAILALGEQQRRPGGRKRHAIITRQAH